MSAPTETKTARWEGYQLGVLHAYEFMASAHDQPTLAADIVAYLLPVNAKDLKKLKQLAQREDITVAWADVEHVWGLRRWAVLAATEGSE